jgi:hypothetical protein
MANHRASIVTETFAPDNLVISHPLSRVVTILANAGALTSGTVLGRITASGKYINSLSAASDGSQTPDVILAEDIANSGSDQTASVYFAGVFNESGLVLGSAHTVASIREGLRLKGIHLLAGLTA